MPVIMNKVNEPSTKEDLVEDCSEDDNLMCQALVRPSPEPNDDLSLPPMNGEQYLRRVIEEAKKCDDIVVANVEHHQEKRSTYLPTLPETKECLSTLLPTKEWQESAIADFSQLRLKVENLHGKLSGDLAIKKLKSLLPRKENDEEWLKICLFQRPIVVKDPPGPSIRVCLAISQVKIWHVLSYFPDWITEGELGIADSCRWIYCLLTCLELPVEPDVYFTMRQIARALINFRATLESPEADELPHINLVVCIISRYFHQKDLADHYN